MELKKLNLKKDTIAELTSSEANSIIGGEVAAKTRNSTNKGFTCCWCTDVVILPGPATPPTTYTN